MYTRNVTQGRSNANIVATYSPQPLPPCVPADEAGDDTSDLGARRSRGGGGGGGIFFGAVAGLAFFCGAGWTVYRYTRGEKVSEAWSSVTSAFGFRRVKQLMSPNQFYGNGRRGMFVELEDF